MERYIAPLNEFVRFTDYWPRDLRKFLFNDRFFAIEQISGGGQAEILKAIDTQTWEKVAVKLYVGAETSDEVLAAFSREHSLLHDTLNGCGGALRIVDYGRHSQSQGLFLVTPWMPATLDTFMNLSKTERVGYLAEKSLEAIGWEEDDEGYEEEYEKTEILVENFLAEEDLKSPWDREKEDLDKILDALVKVYDQGVLHRDIKPSNIFMEYAGEEDPIDAYWVLGDFGASKPLGRNKNSAMTLADIQNRAIWSNSHSKRKTTPGDLGRVRLGCCRRIISK